MDFITNIVEGIVYGLFEFAKFTLFFWGLVGLRMVYEKIFGED